MNGQDFHGPRFHHLIMGCEKDKDSLSSGGVGRAWWFISPGE
jgi:hypothetical protein